MSESISIMKRGPPKIPRIDEVAPARFPDEFDQELKCRLVRERYWAATGESPEEAEMVDFF